MSQLVGFPVISSDNAMTLIVPEILAVTEEKNQSGTFVSPLTEVELGVGARCMTNTVDVHTSF